MGKALQVYVQDSTGSIVWKEYYTDADELRSDLRILLNPSKYGTVNYRVVIHYVDADHHV